MLKVTLLNHTPNPQALIAAAANLCYSNKNIKELSEGISEESASKFVGMLSELGHESPVEHVSFTFGIEGISRACMAQITRHRIASFSVQSQRYVVFDCEFITPPEIEENEEAKEEFLQTIKIIQKSYSKLSNILEKKHKDKFTAAGENEKKATELAQKSAIEDARYILPNACETKLLVTMNARELKHFFSLRCCNRAQWEIRQVAFQMLKLTIKVAPNLFKNSGPSCVRGPCKEGKMSCGKAEQTQELYRNITKY
ncbi:MAG: FAD-dependent thymidylate synthase [Oscillospiraceae bacterium]|jgi:thymidylate synthase (FAD)|nr:FAD-dependent thymidylate synthase [Oscillospiraceae bacterium]